MNKNNGFAFAALALGALWALAGCSTASSGGDMSKNDMQALKNPSKTIPPEAVEGMKKTIEEANRKRQAQGQPAPGAPPSGPPPSAAGG